MNQTSKLITSLMALALASVDAQAQCDDATVSSESELNAAIDDYNLNCSGGETLTATLFGPIVLTASSNQISNNTTAQLVLAGGETIDGDESHRILDIADGQVTVDNLTLQNASATVGGAIRNGVDADLHITGSVFEGNSAPGESGGAILNSGTLAVSTSTFLNNSAGEFAGAISNWGTATITDSSFIDNASGFDGGAISNMESLEVTSSTFEGNEVDSGVGGAIENTESLTVRNCSFDANITNSEVSPHGGAIHNSDEVDIINSTFHANAAAEEGGGISNSGTANVTNTIVSGNTGSDCFNDGGTWNAQEANLDSDGSCADFTIHNADPLLDPLADNDGPTRTLALQLGSPAVDAATACPLPATDQRGASRPQGPACDLGAFELRNLALTIDGAGTGKGSVEATDIACDIDVGVTSGDCQETFAESEAVTLTAEPDPFSEFAGWSGGCSGADAQTTVTLDADKTCTAEFAVVEDLIFKDQFEADS